MRRSAPWLARKYFRVIPLVDFGQVFVRKGLVGFDLLQFNRARASFVSTAGFCSGPQG